MEGVAFGLRDGLDLMVDAGTFQELWTDLESVDALKFEGDVSYKKKLEAKVGGEVEVLVEERNRRGQLAGKSRGNTTVVLEGPDALIGELVSVRVVRVTGTTMIGELTDRGAPAR